MTIKNDNEYLIADFSTDPFGHYLKKTKLLIVVKEIKKWGKHKRIHYKKYVYPVRHDGDITDYSYVIPLKDLKIGDDNIVSFSAMCMIT